MKKLSAFTLVEMLVVIAITGVLITMLLPSLGQSREAAKTVLCMSRMKDMSMRIENYRSDYKTWYPVNYVDQWVNPSGVGSSSFNFVNQMTPYMNDFGNTDWRLRSRRNHFLCPSDYYQPVASGGGADATGIRRTAYISTGWRVVNFMMSGVFGYGNLTTQSAQYRPRREIRTVSPSIAVMMGEIYSVSPVFGYVSSWGSTNIYPHMGGTNILFGAGNVRTIKAANNTSQALYLNNGAANSMQIWFQ